MSCYLKTETDLTRLRFMSPQSGQVIDLTLLGVNNPIKAEAAQQSYGNNAGDDMARFRILCNLDQFSAM